MVAFAAVALLAASASGDLRGAVAGGDDDAASMWMSDGLDALPAASALTLLPPPSTGGVFVELAFPPSRVAIADVFRPPQG